MLLEKELVIVKRRRFLADFIHELNRIEEKEKKLKKKKSTPIPLIRDFNLLANCWFGGKTFHLASRLPQQHIIVNDQTPSFVCPFGRKNQLPKE